jgi:hypothetical protein
MTSLKMDFGQRLRWAIARNGRGAAIALNIGRYHTYIEHKCGKVHTLVLLGFLKRQGCAGRSDGLSASGMQGQKVFAGA